jgi:hypothetical protein
MERRRELARLYPDYFLDIEFLQRLREGLVAKGEMPASYLSQNVHGGSTTGGGNYGGRLQPIPKDRIKIALEVVSTTTQCAEVVALYATQFDDPDIATFRKIVKLPPVRSTRTRTVHSGPFTWILRHVGDKSIICAATGEIHRSIPSNLRFMEVSFFCTAKAYKGSGYARFFNALLQHHAHEVGCTFILVCASLGAVPFWMKPSMSYSLIRADLKSRVELHYRENCIQFLNTELLVWHVTDDTPLRVSAALRKLPAPGVDFSFNT